MGEDYNGSFLEADNSMRDTKLHPYWDARLAYKMSRERYYY